MFQSQWQTTGNENERVLLGQDTTILSIAASRQSMSQSQCVDPGTANFLVVSFYANLAQVIT